jgi:hypothetical protein
MRFLVCSTNGRCRETTSEPLEELFHGFCADLGVDRGHGGRRPGSPSRRPERCGPRAGRYARSPRCPGSRPRGHPPELQIARPTGLRAPTRVSGSNDLTKCRMWAKAPSATALVLVPGVMATGIPRRCAAGTSTSSTPHSRSGNDFEARACARVRPRRPSPRLGLSRLPRRRGPAVRAPRRNPRQVRVRVSTSSGGTGPSPMTT